MQNYLEKTLQVKSNQIAQAIAGPQHENLSLVESRMNVVIREESPDLTITSQDQKALEAAYEVLEEMRDIAHNDPDSLDKNKVLRLIKSSETGYKPSAGAGIKLKRKTLTPRTANQERYMQAMNDTDIVFGLGEAGTGKTYLAVAHALSMLESGDVERIIITRPAVEAGERLGFLPGDMNEKVSPYLQPIFDALRDLGHEEAAIISQSSGDANKHGNTQGNQQPQGKTEIEIAPLAFMRGRTLSKAVVILDEAQNTTAEQMKMFLTRLGDDSTMIITGDPSQVDLPDGSPSGLSEAVRILNGVEGIAFIEFDASDVQRHPLVGRIIRAYNAASSGNDPQKKITSATDMKKHQAKPKAP